MNTGYDLEELLEDCVKTATERHHERAIDYYNTLRRIAEHPHTPNSIRLMAISSLMTRK